MDIHDFWYVTLQVNNNHTGKFTSVTYIPYLVTPQTPLGVLTALPLTL